MSDDQEMARRHTEDEPCASAASLEEREMPVRSSSFTFCCCPSYFLGYWESNFSPVFAHCRNNK